MSDWIELKSGKEVFDRDAEGWEIEFSAKADDWTQWRGGAWDKRWCYRGRPKAERRVVRVREAVTANFIMPLTEDGYEAFKSAKNFVGWVKGSEWREVEYE